MLQRTMATIISIHKAVRFKHTEIHCGHFATYIPGEVGIELTLEQALSCHSAYEY